MAREAALYDRGVTAIPNVAQRTGIGTTIFLNESQIEGDININGNENFLLAEIETLKHLLQAAQSENSRLLSIIERLIEKKEEKAEKGKLITK